MVNLCASKLLFIHAIWRMPAYIVRVCFVVHSRLHMWLKLLLIPTHTHKHTHTHTHAYQYTHPHTHTSTHHTHTHTHIHTYTHKHTCMHTNTHTHTPTHIPHTPTHTLTHTHTPTHTHMHAYQYTHPHTHTHTAHTHTHTHTHIHTYTHTHTMLCTVPPTVSSPASSLTIIEGDNLTLNFTVTGDPPPHSFTWLRNDEQLTNTERLSIADNVLRIRNASRLDSGNFTLRAVSSVGEDSAWTVVEVACEPLEYLLYLMLHEKVLHACFHIIREEYSIQSNE